MKTTHAFQAIYRSHLYARLRRCFHACALVALLPAGGLFSAPAEAQGVPNGFGNNGSGANTLLGNGNPGIGTGSLAAANFPPDFIPFDVWEGLIVIQAYIGDGQSQDAIIATGLPLCLASTEFASKRAITVPGPLRDINIMDRSVRMSNAKPQALRMDRVSLTNVPFGVFNLFEFLTSRTLTGAPSVWLGNSLLASFSITIDPLIQRILLRPAGVPMPIGATVLPFEFKDGRIWVEAKVNGKKSFSALIDTGSVGTLLPASVVKALNLPAATTFAMTHPNGQEGKVAAVQLNEIALGPLKIPDVQALSIAESVKDGFDPELGIIGNDVLLRYRVTIDYGQRKLGFEMVGLPNSGKVEKPAKAEKKPEKKNDKKTDKNLTKAAPEGDKPADGKADTKADPRTDTKKDGDKTSPPKDTKNTEKGDGVGSSVRDFRLPSSRTAFLPAS